MPPLQFRRRPPQSNYPPDNVLYPDYGNLKLDLRTNKGGISRMTPSQLGRDITVSRLSYTNLSKDQCQVIVKVHGVFPSSRGYPAFSPELQFH